MGQSSVESEPVSTGDGSAAQSPTSPAVRTEEQQRAQAEAAFSAELRRYADRRNVDLALAVVNRRTGRTFTYNGQQRFETASIVKVYILAALLLQAENSGRPLTTWEKSLATAMIENSDNAAATELWARIGGLSRSADAFGLVATEPEPAGRWGHVTTTAEDQARLISTLAGPTCPIKDSAYLWDLMRNVVDDQAWGISAAAGPGEVVALKNGWMPSDADGGRWAVNSMGWITGPDTDVIVVVLSRGYADLQGGVSTVEEVAKLARTRLGW